MKDSLAPLGIIILAVVVVQLMAFLFGTAPGHSVVAALWGMH